MRVINMAENIVILGLKEDIKALAHVSAKKVKKVAEGKPVSITHSVAKSYTIPILLYDRNERLMKGQGKGIEYVD